MSSHRRARPIGTPIIDQSIVSGQNGRYRVPLAVSVGAPATSHASHRSVRDRRTLAPGRVGTWSPSVPSLPMARSIWSGTIWFGQMDNFPHENR